MGVFGLKADAELRELLRNYASEVVIRKSPAFIFREGEKAHGFYLVLRGAVRLYLESIPGEKIMERVLTQSYLVGLPATISGHPYSLTCELVEDAELAYLSLRDFSNLMKCETDGAMKLLGLLSGEVQAARAEIARAPRLRSASRTAAN
jgi:CRP-like cAMP-binding protein